MKIAIIIILLTSLVGITWIMLNAVRNVGKMKYYENLQYLTALLEKEPTRFKYEFIREEINYLRLSQFAGEELEEIERKFIEKYKNFIKESQKS